MSFHIQNNQKAQKAIDEFLKRIRYQREGDRIAPLYGMVVDIFVAAGQKNLLYLIKLRRYWVQQSDEFLARHAYPQRISTTWEFKITSQYLETLKKEPVLNTSFYEILKNSENTCFTSSDLFKFLQQRLKRAITPEEKEILVAPASFTRKESVLHLVVYDGAFTQAIQLEMPTYIKQVNQILFDFQIDRIQCLVGDLGQKHQDQIWIGTLASVWDTLLSPEFISHCVPAFIKRSDYYNATLMVYVSNLAVQAQLNTPVQSQKLLDRIYHTFPELQFVIQKVGFIVQNGMNKEQSRLTSLLMAESAIDPVSSYDRLKRLIQHEHVPSELPNEALLKVPNMEKQRWRLSPADSINAVQDIIQRIKDNQSRHQ